MYTQCPNCQSVFGLTEEQIRVRQGLVRCGSCKEVFNATWNLIDSIPAAGIPAGETPEAPTAHHNEPCSPQVPAADNILDDDDSNVLLTSPSEARSAYVESSNSRRDTDSLVATTHQAEISLSDLGDSVADAGAPTTDSAADAAEDDRYEFEFEHLRATAPSPTATAESAASPGSADDDDEFEFEFEFSHSAPRRLLTPTVAESAPSRDATPGAPASVAEDHGVASVARQPESTMPLALEQPSPIAQQPDTATGTEILAATLASDEPEAAYRDVSASSGIDDGISIPLVDDEFSVSSGAAGPGIVQEVSIASEGFAIEYDATDTADADHDLGVPRPDFSIDSDIAVEFDDNGTVYRNSQHDTTPFDVNLERVEPVQPIAQSAATTVADASFQPVVDELEQIDEFGSADDALGLAPDSVVNGPSAPDDEAGIFEDTDSYNALDFDNAPGDDVIIRANGNSMVPQPAGIGTAAAEAPTSPAKVDECGYAESAADEIQAPSIDDPVGLDAEPRFVEESPSPAAGAEAEHETVAADEEFQSHGAVDGAITELVVVDPTAIDITTAEGIAVGPTGGPPVSEADRDISSVAVGDVAAKADGFDANELTNESIDESPVDDSPIDDSTLDVAIHGADEPTEEVDRKVDRAITIDAAATDVRSAFNESTEGAVAGSDGQQPPSIRDADCVDIRDDVATDQSSDIDAPIEGDIADRMVVDLELSDAMATESDDAVSTSEADSTADDDVSDVVAAKAQFGVDESAEADVVEQSVVESMSSDAEHADPDEESPVSETDSDSVPVSEAAATDEKFDFDELTEDVAEQSLGDSTPTGIEVADSLGEKSTLKDGGTAENKVVGYAVATDEPFEFDESSDDDDVEPSVAESTASEVEVADSDSEPCVLDADSDREVASDAVATDEPFEFDESSDDDDVVPSVAESTASEVEVADSDSESPAPEGDSDSEVAGDAVAKDERFDFDESAKDAIEQLVDDPKTEEPAADVNVDIALESADGGAVEIDTTSNDADDFDFADSQNVESVDFSIEESMLTVAQASPTNTEAAPDSTDVTTDPAGVELTITYEGIPSSFADVEEIVLETFSSPGQGELDFSAVEQSSLPPPEANARVVWRQPGNGGVLPAAAIGGRGVSAAGTAPSAALPRTFSAKPQKWRSAAASITLSIAAMVLIGALLWQIRSVHLDTLAESPRLRPVLTEFCKYAACALPARVDVDKIDLAELLVKPHPDSPGALRVSISLINRAKFSQPFPALQVSLTDRSGSVVGRRTYRPEQYLHSADVDTRLLNPNTAEAFALDLVRPDETAVGYEVELISAQ